MAAEAGAGALQDLVEGRDLALAATLTRWVEADGRVQIRVGVWSPPLPGALEGDEVAVDVLAGEPSDAEPGKSVHAYRVAAVHPWTVQVVTPVFGMLVVTPEELSWSARWGGGADPAPVLRFPAGMSAARREEFEAELFVARAGSAGAQEDHRSVVARELLGMSSAGPPPAAPVDEHAQRLEDIAAVVAAELPEPVGYGPDDAMASAREVARKWSQVFGDLWPTGSSGDVPMSPDRHRGEETVLPLPGGNGLIVPAVHQSPEQVRAIAEGAPAYEGVDLLFLHPDGAGGVAATDGSMSPERLARFVRAGWDARAADGRGRPDVVVLVACGAAASPPHGRAGLGERLRAALERPVIAGDADVWMDLDGRVFTAAARDTARGQRVPGRAGEGGAQFFVLEDGARTPLGTAELGAALAALARPRTDVPPVGPVALPQQWGPASDLGEERYRQLVEDPALLLAGQSPPFPLRRWFDYLDDVAAHVETLSALPASTRVDAVLEELPARVAASASPGRVAWAEPVREALRSAVGLVLALYGHVDAVEVTRHLDVLDRAARKQEAGCRDHHR